ncbi:hypothetical protein PISMIDRAFT_451986 [Pisolithus microcarpus 441]|uniref:Unplaced genomic scaffold scaffold_40, whole genome shotgun sequence n=1 Tax=Pisolithus microcarpus 441 TaxID=765257 RepID=A0A0C9Z3K5_9AGAM|nr:hypothetical protein PISMIDRAFT_451986 [Pisolithus microcarpus 441]
MTVVLNPFQLQACQHHRRHGYHHAKCEVRERLDCKRAGRLQYYNQSVRACDHLITGTS